MPEPWHCNGQKVIQIMKPAIIKTYTNINGRMVHDGYFIITSEDRMKWLSIEQLFKLPNATEVK